MLNVTLRSLITAIAFVGLSLTSQAQDYRGLQQTPREMVYQEPTRQPNFFERLFGVQQREAYAPAPQPQYYQGGQPLRQNAYINPDKSNYTNRPSVPKSSVRGVQSYCVRSCDGFFFPLATIKGEAKDSLTEAEACSTLCPGTQTELYKVTNGSIESMVGPNRKAYSSHPKAFAFREKIEQSCSCKGISTGGLARLPMTRDYTLREGDIILLENGAHVFDGGDGYPYKTSDFIMANRGGRLSDETRKLLVAKNISLGRSSNSQLASNKLTTLADGTLAIDLNRNAYQSIRMIDILAQEKQRPKLLIDIIESRRFNKL